MRLPRVRFTVRRLMVAVAVAAGLLAQGSWVGQSGRATAVGVIAWALTLAFLGVPLVLMFLPPAAARRMFYLACGMCLLMVISSIARGRGQLRQGSAVPWSWTFWMILTYGLGYVASRERHRGSAAATDQKTVSSEL